MTNVSEIDQVRSDSAVNRLESTKVGTHTHDADQFEGFTLLGLTRNSTIRVKSDPGKILLAEEAGNFKFEDFEYRIIASESGTRVTFSDDVLSLVWYLEIKYALAVTDDSFFNAKITDTTLRDLEETIYLEHGQLLAFFEGKELKHVVRGRDEAKKRFEVLPGQSLQAPRLTLDLGNLKL